MQIPRTSTIIYGIPVVLNCTVHSFLNITAIYWKAFYDYDKQNAKIIHEGEFNTAGITIDNPSLTLKSPKFHDNGEYLCYARNEAGQTLSRKIPVKVDGGKFIDLIILKEKAIILNLLLQKFTSLKLL